MINWAIVNVSTSLVTSFGQGPSEPITKAGELLVIMDQPLTMDATWYLTSQGAIAPAAGPNPSAMHTIDRETGRWIDGRPIEDIRREKLSALKSIRSSIELGAFEWNGHMFDGDIDAQRRIQMSVMAAQKSQIDGVTFSVDWTMANNQVITLTADDVISLAQAKGAQINMAHEAYRQLRSQVEQATDINGIENIAWPG